MNFPVQACSTCGEQTESLFCPNCRKKLTREQIKVFWNAQSWAQYRATVLDFQSFSSSLPYLETRVLNSPPEDQQPAGRKMGVLVGLVAAGLIAAVLLALWFTRVNDETPKGPEVADVGPDGRPKLNKGKIGEVRRTPRPTALAARPGATAPGGVGSSSPISYDPTIEEVCGVGSTRPQLEPPDQTAEEVCGTFQPVSPTVPPSPEDVSGYVQPEPPDPIAEREAEDISQNQPKTPQ